MPSLERFGVHLLANFGNINVSSLWEDHISEYRSLRLTDNLINEQLVGNCLKAIRKCERLSRHRHLYCGGQRRLIHVQKLMQKDETCSCATFSELVLALILRGETVRFPLFGQQHIEHKRNRRVTASQRRDRPTIQN